MLEEKCRVQALFIFHSSPFSNPETHLLPLTSALTFPLPLPTDSFPFPNSAVEYCPSAEFDSRIRWQNTGALLRSLRASNHHPPLQVSLLPGLHPTSRAGHPAASPASAAAEAALEAVSLDIPAEMHNNGGVGRPDQSTVWRVSSANGPKPRYSVSFSMSLVHLILSII